MEYFNLHSHYLPTSDEEVAIVNCSPQDDLPCSTPCSVGLHPWDVDEEWADKVRMVESKAKDERVWAIGECGLDKLKGGDLSLQRQAFLAQIDIATETCKPVIVHCVKAVDELFAVTAEALARNGRLPQIIIHGFRGKWQQAKQIIAKGMMLSFGNKYNVESLKLAYEVAITSSIPFFLETDDLHGDHLSVRQIYEQAARHLGVDVSHFVNLCGHQKVFCRLR